jgi:Zn-dependent protease
MFAELLVWYLVFLFSTTCHEFAHAFVAYKGGDDTAYEAGQVTLDPTPHIKRSPFGMVLMPLLSLGLSNTMIGWGAAPYNPGWASRYPTRYALMSLAGPLTNLILCAVGFLSLLVLAKAQVVALAYPATMDSIALPMGEEMNTPAAALARGLSVLFSLNLLLAIFNLLPVPPLDGAAALEGFFPQKVGQIMSKLREQPVIGLVGLVVVWQVIGYLFAPAWGGMVSLLYAAYL